MYLITKILAFNGSHPVSNYAGDTISRRSIRGFILCVLFALVSWQSKAQRSMGIISSEAECIAFSETVKEFMFMIHLLRNMKISVKL